MIEKGTRSLLWPISFFGFLFSCPIYGQEVLKTFNFKNQTAIEIIGEIESQSDIVFTFLPSSLPTGKFTFSTTLEPMVFKKQFESLWQRKINVSEDGIIIAPPSDNGVFEDNAIELSLTLIDSDDGFPIIGANIYLPDLDQGTSSDVNGYFTLKGHFLENDKIEVRYLGYDPIVTTVGDLKAIGSLSISAKKHILDDIVIRTQRERISTQLLSDRIDPDKIDLPAAADKDVFTMAQMVPGVYNSSESLQDLQIRGGTPDQVSFSWNNIRLFQNSLFYGRVSAVNPFMVDQINITRNGASADEQASTSGAINMDSKLEGTESTGGKIHVNALYANAGLHTSLFEGRLKVKGAMRRSYSPGLTSPIYDRYYKNSFQFGKIRDIDYIYDFYDITQYSTLTPRLGFGDKSISIQATPAKGTTLDFSYLGFGNNFTYTQEKDYETRIGFDSLSSRTNGYSLQWNQKIGAGLSSNISYAQSDYLYIYMNSDDINDTSAESLSIRNSIEQSDFQMNLLWKRSKFDLSMGYDYSSWHVLYSANASRDFEQYYNQLTDGIGNEQSVYINLGLYTKPWYKFVLGLRSSSFSKALFGRRILEPRLHASIFASNDLTFHAHYGNFHQNLNRRALNNPLGVDNGFWFLSNESEFNNNFIHIVQSKQGSIGAKYSPGNWNIQFDIYRKNVENVWTSAFDFTSAEEFWEFSNLNIKGIEVALGYKTTTWNAAITYDYINDRILTRSTEFSIPSPYSQPHRFSLFGSKRMGRFDFSTQVNFSTGRMFSVPISLDVVEYEGQDEYKVRFEEYFSDRVSNYFRWDVGVKYHLSIPGLKTASLGLQFMNLLNRQNIIKSEYYVSYYQDPPELDFFSRQGLPFVWNLSLDVEF